MAQQIINVGSAPNDGNGDTLRNSQIKVNANVTELYNAVDLKLDKVTTNDVEKVYIKNADGTQGMKPVSEFGGGEENVQSDWNQINILADDFIKNKPELFSGDYNDLINTPALVTNHSELNLDDGTNPHGTTKNDVGLGNADNTSDLGKPISNATQTALNGKANTIHSHVISDVTGLQTALNSKLDKVTTNDVEKVYIKNADGTQSTKPTSDFGTIKGTGTNNSISKFTASGTIADSQIFDDGTKVGIGTISPQARLDVRAQGVLATDIVLRVRNSTDTQNFLVVNGAGDVYNNGAKGVNTNTFFGENVGRNATGANNTAIGVNALRANTTGISNTAIGVSALGNNTTGFNNTAIGNGSLQNNTTATNNTAVGTGALYTNTTGISNTAIGVSALQNNTTGYSNAAIGFGALRANTTGYSNTAIGVSALQNNTTGISNAAIGQNALQNNTTGTSNTAIGTGALQNNTTGISNTAIGVSALQNNTTGISNAAIGFGALLNNTTGANNIAIGNGSLQNNTTATNNTAVGIFSLYSNTTGLLNTAIGNRSLQANISGGDNVAIGNSAARYTSDGITDNTTSNNSIFLGSNTVPLANNQTNQIVIGGGAIGLGSDSVVLGNQSITKTQLRGQVIIGAFASPPTGIEGAIYYDSITKKHRGFNGTAWNDLY